MEELKPPSSFPKTKVTPQLSRIQSAWCCLQQTFSVHTNDGKSSTKSDGDEIFAPPDDFREPRSSLNRSTYSLTSLPINFRSRFTKPVSLQKGRNSYFPDMNSMYKRVGVRFDHQKYSNHSFDRKTDLETDSVSENGEAHLSKLSCVLEDQYRCLQSPGKIDDVSNDDSMKKKLSFLDPQSPICPSDRILSRGQSECSNLDETIDNDAVSIISSSTIDFSDGSIDDSFSTNSKLTKLTEIVLARSEVLQLQEQYNDAIDILDKPLSLLQARIDRLKHDSTESSEEMKVLNIILLNYCQRLGSIHKISGDLHSAEKFLSMGISLLLNESTFDSPSEVARELSNSFSTLATILDKLGRYDDAMVADQKAIEHLSTSY